MGEATATVVNWNVEWRLPTSPSAQILRARIAEHRPDIVCLTEAYVGMLHGGHSIEAEADYGYPIREGRRKVLLWSQEPWSNIDVVGHPDLPTGRFVQGTTNSPFGPITVIGICIPWSGAHVSSGKRDRKPWDDHMAYLAALGEVIPEQAERLIVVGDFNQKVPRSTAPLRAFRAMEAVLADRLTLASGGEVEPMGCALIDHIAHSSDLSAISVWTLDNGRPDGPRLTDHIGVGATLSAM